MRLCKDETLQHLKEGLQLAFGIAKSYRLKIMCTEFTFFFLKFCTKGNPDANGVVVFFFCPEV